MDRFACRHNPTVKLIPPVSQDRFSAVIVTTINVNGIRAAVRERSPENLGLLDWPPWPSGWPSRPPTGATR